MAVSLTAMGTILRAGVRIAFYKTEHANDPIVPYPDQPHLLALVKHGAARVTRDLDTLPRTFTCGDTRYVESLVSCGWEYPQGWGRTRDAKGNIVYDEPDAREDGKVETFRQERNQPRQELDSEIGDYFERKSKT